MAGPWFTVQKSSEWKVIDKIWISNAGKNARARVELRVELENHQNEIAQRD